MGFDVITGVALAGGAYVITFAVYVMRVDKYQSIVRATVLNGFLAYCFYGGALLFDIGRPWHAMNPYIGNNFMEILAPKDKGSPIGFEMLSFLNSHQKTKRSAKTCERVP